MSNNDNELEKMRQRRLAAKIAAENGTVMDLSSLAAKHNEDRRYQQPTNGPVIANLGNPPEGQEWPTHVVIGGEMFMLVPPPAFEQTANMAYNRGFQAAVDLYSDQITTPKVTEQIDYCDMVRRGDWDSDRVEVEVSE